MYVHRKDPSVHKKLLGCNPLGRFVWSTRQDLSGPAISPGIQIDYMNILFLGESVSPLYVHKKCSPVWGFPYRDVLSGTPV